MDDQINIIFVWFLHFSCASTYFHISVYWQFTNIVFFVFVAETLSHGHVKIIDTWTSIFPLNKGQTKLFISKTAVLQVGQAVFYLNSAWTVKEIILYLNIKRYRHSTWIFPPMTNDVIMKFQNCLLCWVVKLCLTVFKYFPCDRQGGYWSTAFFLE